MKTLNFCRENGSDTKKLYKFLKSFYKGVKIKRKKCLGKCKTCKMSPFVLLDDQVVKSKTGDGLYQKINQEFEKEWKKQRKK